MQKWPGSQSALAALLGCLIVACGDDPGLEPVQTPVMTVTPRTVPADSTFGTGVDIVVRVRGVKRLSGHVVEFRVDTGQRIPALGLAGLRAVVDGYHRDTTDVFGGVSVRASRNGFPGNGALFIRVKSLQLADSIPFTNLPRGVHRLTVDLRDTTIGVGGSALLRPRAFDTYGVELASPVIRADSTNIRVSGSRIEGLAVGRASATVIADGKQEAVWITVAPPARLAMHLVSLSGVSVSGIYLQAPDGADRRLLLRDSLENVGPRHFAWSADGRQLWHNSFGVIRSVTLDGVSRAWPFIANDAQGVSPSRDGRFVYYSGAAFSGRVIWRLDTSSGHHEQVGPTSNSTFISDLEPSISPDGRTLVFPTNRRSVNGQTFELAVFDLATSRLTFLGTAGRVPRWSPDGQWIAYEAAERLWVVRPDGTGFRMVSLPGLQVTGRPEWSPDSKWLLTGTTRSAFSPTVTLIEMATGRVLPLSSTSASAAAAWQP